MEREFKRPQAMAQPSLIYAFVARGTVILADHVDFAGSFFTVSGLATKAAQLLRGLPSVGKIVNHCEGGHTFDYYIEDGLTYCVVADDSIKRQIPEDFLLSVKEDFIRMYAGENEENSLSKDFGPKLKEHMQLCLDDSKEIRRVAETKENVLEFANSENVLEHGEKVQLIVDNTGDLHDQILMEVQDLFTKYDNLWPKKVESPMKQLHANHTSELWADVLAVLSRSYIGKKFSEGTHQPNKLNTSDGIEMPSLAFKCKKQIGRSKP
ncbi:vesicle-associated membrane protein 721-like isoform X2 [Miscanthus floridulus]|uniref:vesicle-associated membrane protein 721-like isoform X2 n=1 Tax=Miscanthus floridulus TaxID=154761 RepID=UPI00345A3780